VASVAEPDEAPLLEPVSLLEEVPLVEEDPASVPLPPLDVDEG
jgi:hypothetical protein